MNQGKLEMVKGEMARVNSNILGISELKWTGMGKFNSDDHYIYYCGQESLRRNRVALIVNKESEMQYLGEISKMTEWSLFVSKASHSTSQWSKSVHQPLMLKKLKLNGFMRPTSPLELTTKRCPFHHRELEYKSRKLRDIWNNRQV